MIIRYKDGSGWSLELAEKNELEFWEYCKEFIFGLKLSPQRMPPKDEYDGYVISRVRSTITECSKVFYIK